MKWCLALDASFSRIARATFRALKAMDFYGLGGRKVFIQDVWTGLSVPAPAYANEDDALDEGYRISPYTVVNMRPGLFAAQKAREVCAGLWPAIAKVAIDVEVPTTEPIIYDACLETERLGKDPYIYSGFGAWRTALGSNVISPRLHKWRIWNAYYDCLPPETRTLTSDLRWLPLEDIRSGDKLLAPDENGPRRKWREAIVLGVEKMKRPCFDVLLHNGDRLIA